MADAASIASSISLSVAAIAHGPTGAGDGDGAGGTTTGFTTGVVAPMLSAETELAATVMSSVAVTATPPVDASAAAVTWIWHVPSGPTVTTSHERPSAAGTSVTIAGFAPPIAQAGTSSRTAGLPAASTGVRLNSTSWLS